MTESLIAGRYRLTERIGVGGMSEVWRATDIDLDRVVAVKLLAAEADPSRFDREARAVAGLSHAHVCSLYDYGRAGGRRFIVLEYLPGGSLEERLSEGRPLRDGDTRRIAAEVAAGLAHAHERGVVHRDLKPANILFDAESRAKIADFGIARTGEAVGLTEVGTVLGTAAYISPEQAAGRPATPASDVYAFGVVLFRMLTGRLPFESPDALSLAAMHRDLPAPCVSDLRPEAPASLESVAAAALAKSPADRPRDGGALVAELGGLAPADAEPDTTAVTQILVPPPRRTRRFALAFGAALVAAAGVGLAMAVTLGTGTTTVPPSSSRTTTRSTPAPAVPAPRPESSASASTAEPATSPQTTTTIAPLTSVEATTAPAPTTTAAVPSPPSTTLPSTTLPETTAPATTAETTEPATTTTTTVATSTTTETTTAPTPPTLPG